MADIPPLSAMLPDSSDSREVQSGACGLHQDHLIAPDAGNHYNMLYIGNVKVKESLTSMSFSSRLEICREAINFVIKCSASKVNGKSVKLSKELQRFLHTEPDLHHFNASVDFTITTDRLCIIIVETGEILEIHPINIVSFASSGCKDTLDYLCYVAKNPVLGRACHVLRCVDCVSDDVLVTLGLAFNLRFQQFVQQQSGSSSTLERTCSSKGDAIANQQPFCNVDICANYSSPDTDSYFFSDQRRETSWNMPVSDFAHSRIVSSSTLEPSLKYNMPKLIDLYEDLYSNPQDDLRLTIEEWYHGNLSRICAEQLLTQDGDFLVRHVARKPGQFVLSSNCNGFVKHLLLVDPEGVVRTKDRTFKGICDLITHHSQNHLPIITEDSDMHLVRPIKSR